VSDPALKQRRRRSGNSLVQLHLQGQVQAVGTDVVPVETPAEETHTLVVGTTSKDVSEDGAGVVDQTDDRDGRHQGEDPLGQDFQDEMSVRLRSEDLDHESGLTLVNKHESEHSPEELGSLGTETAIDCEEAHRSQSARQYDHETAALTVQGLESVGERDFGGEDRVGRLDGEVGQHSSHTVSNQLRSEQGKDGDSSVHLVVAAR
jgi:hypothetical protein